MIRRMTATEVKARMLALLDEVEAGEEVEITRHGRPVARLVSVKASDALEGSLSGVALSAADDDGLFSTAASWNLR